MAGRLLREHRRRGVGVPIDKLALSAAERRFLRLVCRCSGLPSSDMTITQCTHGCAGCDDLAYGEPFRVAWWRPVIPPMDAEGWLPSGRHAATLDEVYERFVVEAPFRAERETLWNAFRLWSDLVWALLPDSPMWLNGGFVTHKMWAAPRDVDVAVITKQSIYNSVMDNCWQGQLWTTNNSEDKTKRVQPMGGYVDGFPVIRGIHDVRIWDHTWSSVADANGDLIPGAVKGYVEVVKP